MQWVDRSYNESFRLWLPSKPLRRRRVELERIPDLIILPHPYLPPLLSLLMLDPNLLCVLRDEFPDEAWIPEFAGDTEVLATAHQSVGLAAFDSGRDAFWGKVILFATSDGDKSVGTDISSWIYV